MPLSPLSATPASLPGGAGLNSPAKPPPGQAFESVFVGQMVQIMLENAAIDGEFSGGHGEAMFTGVLAERIGDAIAAQGSFGIAALVERQIADTRSAS